MKFTGKDGTLRIYDGTREIATAASVDIWRFDGVSTWTDIKSAVIADDSSSQSAVLGSTSDMVFIGFTSPFAMLQYLKGNGTNYGVGTGTLVLHYFNGTDFDSLITDINDYTESGGDCFAADGYIGFKIPADWAVGANAYNANLDSDKYYIALMVTSAASTDPDADILAPIIAQYFEVAFASMDFSGPMGRAKIEETLVLNRGKMDAYAHYINGAESKIHEPVAVSFSCSIDDTVNDTAIMAALECGNPDSTNWDATGATIKGRTKNDGSTFNPTFADSTKKAVAIQMLWEDVDDKTEGWAFYEIFYPPDEQSIAEAEDAVSFSTAGGCYGVIERINGFGIRY
ncbi:MAG: hypothetical protein M0P69_11175 [Bacteroidales bacterium]|nr:hypothetical protein [Bacteroidales bacterium]